MPGELLTRWTIRCALVLYALFLAGRLTLPLRRSPSSPSPHWIHRTWGWAARPLWTLACLLLLAHLGAAMHFYHGWSNAAAVLDTAQQTETLLGLRFGEGIYFSYLFALLWAVDVAWWWIRPASYERRGAVLEGLIHAYMFFIAFNGAIVLEAGPTRWLGVPVTLILGGLAVWRLVLARRPAASPLTVPARSTHHQ